MFFSPKIDIKETGKLLVCFWLKVYFIQHLILDK